MSTNDKEHSPGGEPGTTDSENSAADAGSESPEEGQKAMDAAEDATIGNDGQ